MSVAPVIFGAGDGEAVAEPVELLGIDPIDAKTAFQQGFDDRALRHFDRHPNDLGRGAGAPSRCRQTIQSLLPRSALLSCPSDPGRRNERQSLYWRSRRT